MGYIPPPPPIKKMRNSFRPLPEPTGPKNRLIPYLEIFNFAFLVGLIFAGILLAGLGYALFIAITKGL